MKVQLPVTLAAVLLLPGLSSGASAVEGGYILFFGANCGNVVATDFLLT